MVLILPSFLVIIHYIIINTIKLSNNRLLLRCILSTGHRCLEPPDNLETITLVVFHSCRGRLIIINIKNLLKIIRRSSRTSIPNYPEQNGVRVILNLNIFIHPYLANEIK
uniref:C5 protein n=1 Tax=Malvastrum yellow vein Yunnan virus TaxID=290030 RepID=A0A6G7MBN3_9GEMI|nr:C5 protein [Malvastrum yellow vein Yunnan virus]QIH55935.1 C5 protein [Malvastrum yellow vein Yunnan virus]QIH55945.1 C5 protein [Malvastrum yellow vein Yunnan virus]QIH55960.1 C5 [Malvastrum yellow vein Yunnan virus]QIH56030.1 C5 protein [Malvastrum yellow vein Yunnan virus]